ncbi:MAG: hypothetical protein CMI12_12305, partial [Oceanospirillum sp.]|nr:hypothetical protein [Oceanospirillum sp.]
MCKRLLCYLISLVMFALLSACSDEPQSKDVQKEPVQNNFKSTSSSTVAESIGYESHLPFKLLDISEQMYGDVNAIAVKFSQPLKSEQLFTSLIKIQPHLPDPVLTKDGRTLFFTGIKPEKSYQIVVDQQILANQGQWLPEASEKTLKTRAMPATVNFEVNGAVMVPGKVDALP